MNLAETSHSGCERGGCGLRAGESHTLDDPIGVFHGHSGRPRQFGVVLAGEAPLDVSQRKPGRLQLLDRGELEQMVAAVEGRATAKRRWPIDHSERLIPADCAGVGQIADPAAAGADIAAGQEPGQGLDQFGEREFAGGWFFRRHATILQCHVTVSSARPDRCRLSGTRQ